MKKTLVTLAFLWGWAAVAQPISPSMYCKVFGRFHVARCVTGYWIFQNGIGGYQPASGSALLVLTSSGPTRAVTVSRSSNQSCHDSSGNIKTMGNNVPCVENASGGHTGVLMENSSTNVFLTSSAPATQTITLGTGNWTGSFDSGSGNIVYSAGTVTATGLPCMVTSGTSGWCTFNVSVGGTVTATVSGAVVAPQLENKAFATSYIPTTGSTATRATQTISFTNPLIGKQASYAIGGTLHATNQPLSSSCFTFMEAGAGNAPNAYELQWSSNINNNQLNTWDSSGAALSFNVGPAGYPTRYDSLTAVPPAFRNVAANFGTGNTGLSARFWLNGVGEWSLATMTNYLNTSGTGTGLTSSQQTPVYIGSRQDGSTCNVNGWLTDICISTDIKGCTP